MKCGANKLDQYQIKKGFEAGMTAGEISRVIKVRESVVASFAPKPKRGRPSKSDA